VDTRGADWLPTGLILEDVDSATRLAHLLEEMRVRGLSHLPLLFNARADVLLRTADVLRRHLRRAPRGQPATSAIHIFVMGLENFDDEHLLRLNKGFDGRTVLAAVNTMRELEAEFPGRFVVSGYMPYSIILFTPGPHWLPST
jgi:radical SAM superfamily enzyme YgiQ (UPF0313 family)